ncbi:hypothetical protein LshimejAT787_3000140 [Lyophyllum shimeji]|nr:hypothetical protein LshimejAT787_3000140 [Lyophyllum shimeji]
MLRKYEGELNFATDAWTSPNHKAYVAVTVHLEHDGVPITMLLDVVEVAESHTGVNLAVVFADILREYGISDKILSVTCDNASNNDVMIEELAKRLPDFSVVNHTRCFLHVTNLVAKSIVRQFDVKKADADAQLDAAEAELHDIAAGLELEEALAAAERSNEQGEMEGGDEDNDDGWVDEVVLLSDEERKTLETSIRPVKLVLAKLRKIAFKIIHSSTLLGPAWKRCLEDLDMSVRLMPRDVTTRWNSTFDMLSFAVDYRKAIDELTGDRKNELRKFELSEREWTIAEQLCKVLSILKDATLFFSRGTPNLATVIPAMDYIDTQLTNHAHDRSLAPSIRAALGIGKKTLNQYYELTDSSEVYRIAMILHPRHKLSYFMTAGWKQEWIDTAEELLRAEFDRSYRQEDMTDDEEVGAGLSSCATNPSSRTRNVFDNLPSLSAPSRKELRDEVDRYLSTDPEKVDNVLLWWFEHRAVYPCLSRMALDYLTIPATSVDVERVFSRSHLILSHVRNRLSAQSTRALLCVGNWSLLGLVKDSDVSAVSSMPDVDGDEDIELDDGWDSILL